MRHLKSWTTEDGKVLLHFADPVLEVFARYRQLSPEDAEAGGLLLGTVHGEHLLVTAATEPKATDRRFRFWFERGPDGHQATADRLWRESGGTVRYLGEWHSHPEDCPSPSGTDRREWRALAERRADGRPALTVIVGRHALHVALVSPSGPTQTLATVAEPEACNAAEPGERRAGA